MPVVHATDLLPGIRDGKAVAAFNVITVEHAQGIVAGAERVGLPVVLQLSENAIRYHGGLRAIAAAMVEVARASTADVVLHLDHVTDPELARLTPDIGFSSVMYDGSHLDFGQNRDRTREVARWARGVGIWVEAELGEVAGKDGAHAPGARTDPSEAVRFVAGTDVHSLAVAVGSSHAMVDKTARLDLDLIDRLHEAVPVPLVLHGSSGVRDDVLAQAAHRGMSKINIGTALNVVYTGAIRDRLARDPKGVDPRRYLAGARDAIAAVVAHYLDLAAGGAREPLAP